MPEARSLAGPGVGGVATLGWELSHAILGNPGLGGDSGPAWGRVGGDPDRAPATGRSVARSLTRGPL